MRNQRPPRWYRVPSATRPRAFDARRRSWMSGDRLGRHAHWRASDPPGPFWQGRLVWFGAAGWCANIAPRLPPAKPDRHSAKCSCDAVRMIPVFLSQTLPNTFERRMFAIMPSRLYACHHDGLHHRNACVTADQRAPCLRTSRAIGLAVNAARVRLNRQFSARDHYIWTLLARPLKSLESHRANILQEWRRRGYQRHCRVTDSRLRRVLKSKYPYSREG